MHQPNIQFTFANATCGVMVLLLQLQTHNTLNYRQIGERLGRQIDHNGKEGKEKLTVMTQTQRVNKTADK